MPKKIIDLSGIGGLAPRYYGDRPFDVVNWQDRYIGAKDMYATGIVNPMAKYGYLSPASNSFDTVTGAITSKIVASLNDRDNTNMWLLDGGTKLWKLDNTSGDDSLSQQNEITGAEGIDMVDYVINGARRFFYSYKKTGGGDICIFEEDGTGFDDTWLSSTATGGFNTGATNDVRLIIADNGFLYLLDGSDVHKIDGNSTGGANGTATANVLSFPTTFILRDGVDFRGNTLMALVKDYNGTDQGNNFAGVYVWDRRSGLTNMNDFIGITGINDIKSLFTFRGGVWAFTVSTDGRGQLRQFNSSSFQIVRELGKDDFPNLQNSVKVVDDFIIWLANDGGVFVYGKIDYSAKDGLYQIGDVTDEITGSSPIFKGGAINAFGSFHSGSRENFEVAYDISFEDSNNNDYYIRRFYPNSHDAPSNDGIIIPNSGDFKTLLIPLPKLSHVKSATLYYPKEYTGSATTEVMYVDFYFNGSRTSWGQKTLTRDDGVRGYKNIEINKPNVNFIQVGLSYNTNSVFYSITPSYMEIEYEETTKKI